jgi:NTP pyrophosphatase (non-canonical NTP hydrolase)
MKTIEQIAEEVSSWGETTFPDATIEDLLTKLDEEYGELKGAAWLYLKLRRLVSLDPLETLRQELLDEIADNFIVLFRLTKALGADVRQVIEAKWDVVRARDYSKPKIASSEVAE